MHAEEMSEEKLTAYSTMYIMRNQEGEIVFFTV